MVILYEIEIQADLFVETFTVEAFVEKATVITEYLWFDDFDVRD